ncbi:DUF2142 domain-containing protein [Nocardioides pocheonensis]|uniref:DUF2142 domain-containing protein n=1 Tax=Nocardioides pocheonensis TaxID=661485 RepID=UPI0016080A27|nr:DUF2142 domain-containing protein [Nocardioides pocheonensis]
MSVEAGPPDPGRNGSRRVAAWAAAGLFGLQLAWLLVMPPATGIDEFDHVYRASSVAIGHWRPGTYELSPTLARGAMLPVRADIVEAAGPACARLPYTKPFNCRPYKDLGDGVVEVATGVDYYNPLYYGVVGALARPFSGSAAIDVMRLVSIVECAAMFGLAVFLTTLWARSRWPLLLLLAACLPTTVYSASIATPNGVQMVSGILVWAAALAMLRVGPNGRRPAYVGLMVGVAVMANTHTLGLFWLALIALTLMVYAGPVRVLWLARPRSRPEVAALGVALAAVAFQLWWMAYAQPNTSRPEGGLPGNPWGQIAQGVIAWPLQAVAAFPYRNESAPAAVYGVALVAMIALAVFTARALRGAGRDSLAMAVVLVLSAAVPVAITYSGFHRYGMSWQGRYGMPYSAGVFALAGLALEDRGPALRGAFLWLGLVGWGAAETLGITGVLAKQIKDHELVSATHWWAPPTVLVVALGALATASWSRSVQLVEGGSPPAADEANPRGDAVPRAR